MAAVACTGLPHSAVLHGRAPGAGAAVGGDAFDFAVDDETLHLAVVDVDGDAELASLVATLAVTALRNARRAGLALEEQAALAGEAVWRQHHGERVASGLLLSLGRNGSAVAVAAGCPRLFRVRAGKPTAVALSRQPPLGAEPELDYRPERLDLRGGDRVVVLSDGVHAGRDDAKLARGLRGLPAEPGEAVRLLIEDVLARTPQLDDDATVVCLDWADRSG